MDNNNKGFEAACTAVAEACNRLAVRREATPDEIMDALLNCAVSLMYAHGCQGAKIVDGIAYKTKLFARQYKERKPPVRHAPIYNEVLCDVIVDPPPMERGGN